MAILVIVLALGIIIAGVLLLKKSAKKFILTPKQLAEIKQRNQLLDKENSEQK